MTSEHSGLSFSLVLLFWTGDTQGFGAMGSLVYHYI